MFQSPQPSDFPLSVSVEFKDLFIEVAAGTAIGALFLTAIAELQFYGSNKLLFYAVAVPYHLQYTTASFDRSNLFEVEF